MRRKKKARRGWRKLEEEEEEASPGFVDSWLRRCMHASSLEHSGSGEEFPYEESSTVL